MSSTEEAERHVVLSHAPEGVSLAGELRRFTRLHIDHAQLLDLTDPKVQAHFGIDETVLRAHPGSPRLREIAAWAHSTGHYDGLLAPSAYDENALTIVIFREAIPAHVTELNHRIKEIDLEHRDLALTTHKISVIERRLKVFFWTARRALALALLTAITLETLIAILT